KGGFGYGEIKKRLADAADQYLDGARAKRLELESNPDKVREILRIGAEKARVKARAVLDRAKSACGLKH
ncbi:MAG: tryptophan--tRNA ligase, partial [Pirellula sp.]